MAEQGSSDRLIIDIDEHGQVSLSMWWDGVDQPEKVVDHAEMAWPLDGEALEELRWYLEDYLIVPFAVYSDRGRQIAEKIPAWGEAIFNAVFTPGPAHSAYAALRTASGHPELVIQSTAPRQLGLPWELIQDPARGRPLALDGFALTRRLPLSDLSKPFPVSGDRLRVLMVISRPSGEDDVGYQMIARPLLERLDAVRGNVELVVLRPPTLDHLQHTLTTASQEGQPFQVVHFDGHGVFASDPTLPPGRGTAMYDAPIERGMLLFEKEGGGPDPVDAGRVAQVLASAHVPVVVLNACQSGQIGTQIEAAVATRLIKDGTASVIAMAYSVYAVAAAEFMAVFYERLFAGDRIADATTQARSRLHLTNHRPSPKGPLPLHDWIVPVHYRRRDISFPNLHTPRPPQTPTLDALLDHLRTTPHPRQPHNSDSLDPVGTFIGRDNLLFALDTAARLQRVVVLYGPGGTGKTELAKAFGRWWRDTGGVDQPEFVFWHSFEPGVASFGLDGLITSLGLNVFGADFAALEPEERLATVERFLAEYRVVWLWDNFETVHTMPDPTGAVPPLHDEETDALRGFLHRVAAKSKSAIVITSRSPEDWLGPQTRRIKVGGLNREEVISYTDQVLAPYPATKAQRDRPAFEELVAWLDGHPLSMRLTLPLLDTTSPERLLGELRGMAPLPVRDGGDRTTSLGACIAYSFTHLSERDRNAIVMVSLFHTLTDSDVLGLMCQSPVVPDRFRGLTSAGWEEVLGRAAGVGLLSGLGSRMYRIHPALPSYLTAFWQQLAPGTFAVEKSAAQQAFLEAYAGFADWLSGQWRTQNAQMAVEVTGLHRPNLSAMLAHALEHQHWSHAADIAALLNDYWDLRGLGVEARGWVDRIQQAVEDPPGTPPDLTTPAGDLWALLTHSQANRYQNARQLDQADTTYQTLLHAFQQLPATDPVRRNIAGLYHQLGRTAEERGDLDQADHWYRQSLTINEELRNRPGMAGSYHQLGMTAQDRGDLDQADHWYRQSLTITEELRDRPGMAITYGQLGLPAEERGDLHQALTWTIRVITLFDTFSHPVTGPAPHHLQRLTQQLGATALHTLWHQTTGQPLPPNIRTFATRE